MSSSTEESKLALLQEDDTTLKSSVDEKENIEQKDDELIDLAESEADATMTGRANGEEGMTVGATLGIEEDDELNNVIENESSDEDEDVFVIVRGDSVDTLRAKRAGLKAQSSSYVRPEALSKGDNIAQSAEDGGDDLKNEDDEGGSATTKSEVVDDLKRLRYSFTKTAFDIDVRGLEDKPWRRNFADISEYFNYGFSEASWMLYCEKQLKIRAGKGEGPPLLQLSKRLAEAAEKSNALAEAAKAATAAPAAPVVVVSNEPPKEPQATIPEAISSTQHQQGNMPPPAMPMAGMPMVGMSGPGMTMPSMPMSNGMQMGGSMPMNQGNSRGYDDQRNKRKDYDGGGRNGGGRDYDNHDQKFQRDNRDQRGGMDNRREDRGDYGRDNRGVGGYNGNGSGRGGGGNYQRDNNRGEQGRGHNNDRHRTR